MGLNRWDRLGKILGSEERLHEKAAEGEGGYSGEDLYAALLVAGEPFHLRRGKAKTYIKDNQERGSGWNGQRVYRARLVSH